MKQTDLLSVTSILSVLLLALHISQDIVFGFDRAGAQSSCRRRDPARSSSAARCSCETRRSAR